MRAQCTCEPASPNSLQLADITIIDHDRRAATHAHTQRIKAYYQDYYLSNPFFGPLESMLKAPPINKLLCVYGINLKTEVGYYYKRQPDDRLVPLQLDPEANPSFPGHETEGTLTHRSLPLTITRSLTRSMMMMMACVH